jgi:hypothetical protein
MAGTPCNGSVSPAMSRADDLPCGQIRMPTGSSCHPRLVRGEADLLPGVLACAATQRGVFTSTQAYAAGHTEKQIQRLRRRHLVSLRRGIYALKSVYESASAAQQHEMRVAALALALTAPAVLSHQNAAAELGMELLDADYSELHVTRPAGVGSRSEAGVEHHIAELREEDVVRRSGALDLTSLARTAIDVARDTDRLECALAACDSALRMGVSREALQSVLERCRSWPGARLASGAVPLADGRAANPGESWSRAILIAQGVAPDDIQVPIYDADGLVGIVDFRWKGVIGELDGKHKYNVPDDASPEEAAQILWKEKRREDRLRVDNEVVRWGYAEHYRPEVIGDRVRQALARAVERGWRAG